MKLWSSDFIFHAPWKQTTEAVWKKYPNELNPNVLTIDVIDRTITDDGRLLTTRLFGSRFSFPQLIVKLLGLPEMQYAIEFSEVDLKSQKMTQRTVNYTFGSVLTVNEKLVYSINKDNPNETHLKQGAKIHINGISFANYFEQMIVDTFDATSHKGRQAVQNVLNVITVENILDAVANELNELKSDIDNAVNKFDSEYNITERVLELTKDLETASDMINDEIQSFSSKLQTEFLELANNLDSELSRVVISLEIPEQDSKVGLYEAVKQAGISGKTRKS